MLVTRGAARPASAQDAQLGQLPAAEPAQAVPAAGANAAARPVHEIGTAITEADLELGYRLPLASIASILTLGFVSAAAIACFACVAWRGA